MDPKSDQNASKVHPNTPLHFRFFWLNAPFLILYGSRFGRPAWPETGSRFWGCPGKAPRAEGGVGGRKPPPVSRWSSTPDQRVGGFVDDPLRSALARRPACTLRMYTLLRMLAPCLASALSRYHPGWDPTPRTPPPGTPPPTHPGTPPPTPPHPPHPIHPTPPHPTPR